MDVERTLAESADAIRRGELAQAETLCRLALEHAPRHFHARIQLADILALMDRPKEAIAAYAYADRLVPGHAGLFTRSATVRFRMAFGPPPPPRREDDRPRIQIRSLGLTGRFGNQLLQYAFVRFYAEQHNLVAEFPDWIGRYLYDFDDPLPSAPLPHAEEKDGNFFGALNGQTDEVLSGHNVHGYFCGDTTRWGDRADAFRRLFVPGGKIRPLLERAWKPLDAAGRTIVAIHLRRTDIGFNGFWIAPVEWYLSWLREIWPHLQSPVLYVATDTPALVGFFSEFACWDATRLGVDIPGAEFMVDHYVLSQADHVAISNSSFSFTAAMLNDHARTFARPDPDLRRLVPFRPWSSDVLVYPVIRRDEVPQPEQVLLTGRFRVTGPVFHMGQYCAPWTNLARAVHRELRIGELGPQVAIDGFRQRSGLAHIGHLIVEDADALPRVVEGAERSLSRARIDTLHFRVTDGQKHADAALLLRQYGYDVLLLTDETPKPVESGAPLVAGSYVAMQERLIPFFLGLPAPGLDVAGLCRKYDVGLRGVLRVGAHDGRDVEVLESNGAGMIVLIEANPALHARLAEAMRGRHNIVTVSRAICDKVGTAILHVTSPDIGSSLLRMTGYSEIYPHVSPSQSIDVATATLDGLFEEMKLDSARINVLDIDAQGAEALVLKGAQNVLRHIEAVAIEVYFSDLYRNCAQIEQIDEALEAAGFRRVATLSPSHSGWGDAFYVRR